jgi:hypothetical protein
MYLQPTSRKPKALLAALVVGTLVLLASPALMGAPAQAQQGPTPTVTLATTITFAGTVDSLGPRFIVVDGLMVDLQRATLPPGGLQLGAIVTVVGTVQNSVVQATVVQLGGIDAGTSSATPAVVIPAATSTPLPGTTIHHHSRPGAPDQHHVNAHL